MTIPQICRTLSMTTSLFEAKFIFDELKLIER